MSDDRYEEIIVNKFNEESARKFRAQVIKRAMHDSTVPIIINIDSYGGSVDSLDFMLETIQQVPNEIITVCMGKAMSAGAVLLAAGDIRFCGKFSRVMIHQASAGAGGPVEEQQKNVNENIRLNSQLITFLAERCGVTEKYLKDLWKEHEARDLYLDAQGALDLGLVDFVGLPHVRPVVQYVVEVAPEKEYAQKEKATKKKTKKKASKATRKKTKKRTKK